MELLDIMKKRYSVRSFKNIKVEDDKIKKIVDAALLAPTAHNNEPCRIRIINSNEGLNNLKKVTECHYDAPLAFLVSYKENEAWVREFDNKSSGDIDSTIITTYMMLEAESLGLSTCYVMYFIKEKAIELFDLDKDEEPSLILLVGYKDDNSKPSHQHNEKKNKNEIIKEI